MPGIPPLWVGGGGGGHGFPSLRHDQFVGVVGGGGHPQRGAYQNNRPGASRRRRRRRQGQGGRFAQSPPRYSLTSTSYASKGIVALQGRRTEKKRFRTERFPPATDGDRYVPGMRPPRGRRGWPERVYHMPLKNAVRIRRGRRTCEDRSTFVHTPWYLYPLPGAVTGFPSSPNLPYPQMPGWARQGRRWII